VWLVISRPWKGRKELSLSVSDADSINASEVCLLVYSYDLTLSDSLLGMEGSGVSHV